MTSERPSQQAKPAPSSPADSFSLLFHNHPIPMWIYDLQSLTFLEVNDAAVERYGYTRDEFLGMTINEIRPQEDVERLQAHVKQQRSPLQHAGPRRHRLKNGCIIDVEITSHTIEFSGGTGALVMAQDVTDRKQAEQALRRQVERLRNLHRTDQAILRAVEKPERWHH